MEEPVYLDHHATTPVDPRVEEAIRPYARERFGNPASGQHAWGWAAEKAVERARARVADLLGAEPREVVFTSGGTEADNLAVKGVAFALADRGRHLVVSAIEGRAVLDAAGWLQSQGWQVTRVAPDGRGRVAPEAVASAIRDDTVLVSVQAVNPEVGTLQPLAEIAAAAAQRGVWLHTDATQAAAWLPLDMGRLGIGLLSLSGHRMFGPKGIGALCVRRRDPRVRLVPLLHGGGQERGRRAGTVNVAGAVGMGMAAELVRLEGEADRVRVAGLRDRLEGGLLAVGGVHVLGDAGARLPNTTAVSIDGVEGEALVVALPSVAFAAGSACTSGNAGESHVLAAMGVPKSRRDTSVRFALGRFTTGDEVDEVLRRIADAVVRIRR